MVAAGQHADAHPVVARARRSDGGAEAGVVGADTEHTIPLRLGDDRRVGVRFVRARDGVPGVGEVAVPVFAKFHCDLSRRGHPLDRRRDRAADQVHPRPRCDQEPEPALCHCSATDHDHTTIGQIESDQVVGLVSGGSSHALSPFLQKILHVSSRTYETLRAAATTTPFADHLVMIRGPPPAPSTAAASATLGDPVAECTRSDGFATSTAASSPTANPRTGTPNAAAASRTAGSAALRSRVHRQSSVASDAGSWTSARAGRRPGRPRCPLPHGTRRRR